ncbi:MAG TPA: pilus assembly protein N-terminal domain-containing protein [Acidobacteriaceae bacterium]|nr:pilus assembly protein N-terminal domain-containing protein [Acidobacteriaceae bacterium]
MRARIRIAVLCFYALSCLSSTGPAVRAQASVPPQPGPDASSQDSANELFVTVGQSVLVDTTQPITRVAMGLGDVAEATATSPTEVMVNGKVPGITSLIVWEAHGARQFFKVMVRPSSYVQSDTLAGVQRELRMELPGQRLKLSSEGGLIFLRGTVKDLNSSQRAYQIASTAGKVVNLLYVDVPPAQPQILLKVRFASVDLTELRQLGINIFSVGAANTIGTVTTGQFQGPSVSTPSNGSAVATISNALNIALFRQDLGLGATIQALQNDGVIQVLAEPNLLAADGKQASFLAGGEYPYPVVQGITGGGTGAVTIQFQEFGVRLNFIPTLTPRNTIRLQVAPEVSSLDFTNGVQISGFTVPALDVRKMNTEVEMAQGQSLAVGGLLDNRETQNLEKVPFIGDIPILGKLFQSISKTKTKTELIVIVTPEIVAPIPAGAPLPKLNYPEPFLPPNSKIPMTTPDANVTGAKPLPPSPPKIPIEKLMDSMKPEKPLVIQSGSGGGGGGGGGSMPQ